MSIFKRSSSDQQAGATTVADAGRPPEPSAMQGATPGVVPPPAAPIYSMRPPESGTRAESETESLVAEKVRVAREAQQSAQERVRMAVRRARTTAAPAPGAQRRPVQQSVAGPRTPFIPSDPASCAQAGLLGLAWRWQEAGAPIRAIHMYVELLTRYPDTPAAAAAVADLVTLSEKLANEGQFHTAAAIYDHLEHLA